jgi:CheY-like chemotaxis protein
MDSTATNDSPGKQADLCIAKRGLKALLVEDYLTMRKAIVQVLSSLNMEIVEACNGVEAIQTLDREHFDIVFTDLVMPEMDGFELCEEIRRRPDMRNLPIVVISTHRDAPYVLQALQSGADDYLTKPFTAPLAERVVERILSNVQ